MSEQEVKDFLEHYGVPGMKWGVRKARKQEAKADKKYLRSVEKSSMQLYNQAAGAMNAGGQDRINNSPKYKGKDLSKPGKLQNQYYEDSARAMAKELNKALANTVGDTSSTGNYKAQFLVETGSMQPYLQVSRQEVKHAASDDMRFDVTVDRLGHILKYRLSNKNVIAQDSFDVDDFLSHYAGEGVNMSDTDVEDFLAHYGVPGMKWGVRKAKGARERSIQKTTQRTQKSIDRLKRVSTGSASKGDKFVAAYFQGVYGEAGANKVLDRGARNQAKVAAGKGKAISLLAKANNIRFEDLDYSR